MGVEVRPPTPKEVETYGLNQNQGVVITWLDSKSPFKEAGFEIGDMILAISGQPVEGVESFADVVSSLKSKERISVLALDHRTGNTGNVFVVIG